MTQIDGVMSFTKMQHYRDARGKSTRSTLAWNDLDYTLYVWNVTKPDLIKLFYVQDDKETYFPITITHKASKAVLYQKTCSDRSLDNISAGKLFVKIWHNAIHYEKWSRFHKLRAYDLMAFI